LPWTQKDHFKFPLENFRDQIFKNKRHLPSSVNIGKNVFNVKYTIDEKLNNFIIGLISEYRPDFASIAVVDNETGNVIGLVDFGRKEGNLGAELTLNGEHPSASLFKIVTSADMLQSGILTKDSLFTYKGRSTTLYRSQLTEGMKFKTNEQTFMQAFSKSNNVIFGKAALMKNDKESLIKMAQNFGLEEDLMEDFPLPKSKIYRPTDTFGLAELATGFNKETTMNSIHGAILSQVVANGGILKYPKIVHSVEDSKFKGHSIWSPGNKIKTVLRPEVAEDLKEMMEFTVQKGTAKKLFRELNKNLKAKLSIGGKTGSITGGGPFGKRDWFTAFAIPHPNQSLSNSKGISICVMIINVNKWYVKSTFLTRKIIEYYFGNSRKKSI
jgi:peptidoglycan glycosyltransferase